MLKTGGLGSRLQTIREATTRTRLTDVSDPSCCDQHEPPFTKHVVTDGGVVLDSTRIQYSYKHSCMVSIFVGQVDGIDEWHLPTYDPRNENKYHYKLHSLDMYFWTQKDALQFVNGIRRVLPPSQVDVQDEPSPPPIQAQAGQMSTVVQKLEQAAITDQQPKIPAPQQSQPTQNFAPPPISAVAVSGEATQPANYAPIAYNPAAPAAPEALRAREKTPPAEDGGINPLHMAVAQDQMLSPSFAPHMYGVQPGSMPGPPSQYPPGMTPLQSPHVALQSPGFAPAGYGSPSVHPGLARASTMPAHGLPSPGLASPYGSAFPGSPGLPPPQAQATMQPTQPAQATTTQVAGQATNMPPTTIPPPPGGFSTYRYAATPGASAGSNMATPVATTEYSVHQNVYRPTQDELRHSEIAGNFTPKEKSGSKKLEENAGRIERGVTGMLKKFEKKFG